MPLATVVELGGLVLSQWAKASSNAPGNKECPFSAATDVRENSILMPEIALGGLLAARMSLIHNQLIQRGFLLGSCVVCDNDLEKGDFHQSVGLSPTLITKLACSCNLPLVPHNVYNTKQRLFLAQEALKIIDRCGIKYKSHCLLHRRFDLHEVVSSRSIPDINNYFGGSIAIFFTWLKFLTVSLTLPSYIGLFVFLYQHYSGIFDDWYTPLYCCCVIVWNIVFVKLWRQHVSISKFSWGQNENDQIITVDEPPKLKPCKEVKDVKESSTALRLIVYWIGGSCLCLFFLCTVPIMIAGYLLIMKIPDNLGESTTLTLAKAIELCSFNLFTLDKPYLGLLLYSAYSIVVEKIGRYLICPIFVKQLFGKQSIAPAKEWKNAAVHVDIAYTLIARFAILIYLCLWKHEVPRARALMSLKIIIFQIEILYSAKLQKREFHSFHIPKSARNHKFEKRDTSPPPSKRKLFKEVSMEMDPSIGTPIPRSNTPGEELDLGSLTDSNVTSATIKKKKKFHFKNITRVANKVKNLVGRQSSHSPDQEHQQASDPELDFPEPVIRHHHHTKMTHVKRLLSVSGTDVSSSDDEEEVVLTNDKKCEEWKPQTKLDVTQSDGNLLMEDVYAPVFHIEMGHTNKIYLFGVVAIFSGICPLAPMIVIAQCAAIYNQDLTAIYSSQRPLLSYMRNIEKLFEFLKEWMLFVESLCFISIVVNCYLAFAVSPNGHLYIPDVIFGEDTNGALWFTVAFEHFCLLAYILFNLLLVDVPSWVMQGVEDAKLKENKKRISERRLLYELQNPNNSTKAGLEKMLLLKDILNIEENAVATANIESIAATKIATLYNSCGWALNPFVFLGLTVVPTILHYFYEPLYHYSIPVLLFFAFYVNSLHERRVKTAVMGMISDPEILRLLVKDLPQWVRDSDRHQCEWMNAIAQQCMHMCAIFEIKLQTKLNDTFERIKPAFVTGMVMESFSFGTIPPNILSVKVLPSIPGKRTITADVEFSYAGNFRMLIDVGLLGQSMKLDFYDLRLSGEARVQIEPSDLSPEVAAAQANFKPFTKANICFMKKPYVDISFSLGDTDGKKMKSSARGFEANLGQIVKNMIATKALYPKSIQINLDKSTSTGESYSIANPIGVLQVQILSGTDLEIGDITTSDPFVEVRYADEIEKTAVYFKTLNPVWNNEVFEFLVFNEDMAQVELIVYDYDLTSSPDFLGSVSFDFCLDNSGVPKEMDLPLKGVSTGNLQVSVTYYRLKETEVKKQIVDDLLGCLPQEIILGDIINPDYALPLVDSETGYKEMKMFQETKRNNVNKKRRNSVFGTVVRNVDGLLKNFPGNSSPTGENPMGGQSSIMGVLMVSRIACKELLPPSGGMGLALSAFTPYVQFIVNGLKRRTKSAKGTLNPSFFDEYKAFILRDDNSSSFDDLHVTIKLKSQRSLKKDTTIGTVTLLLKHILANAEQEMYIDQPFVNADGKEEGRIQAKLQVISAKL